MDDFATAAASLNDLESLDLDALRRMYRLEMAGEAFYEHLASGVGNDEAAALLRANGREERKHAERIARMIGLKQGAEFVPAGDDLEPLAINLPEVIPVALLPFIVAGELNGDSGYQRWADHEPDPEVERLLRLNGREETIHAGRVSAVLELLQP